jgi:hypothetical protein
MQPTVQPKGAVKNTDSCFEISISTLRVVYGWSIFNSVLSTLLFESLSLIEQASYCATGCLECCQPTNLLDLFRLNRRRSQAESREYLAPAFTFGIEHEQRKFECWRCQYVFETLTLSGTLPFAKTAALPFSGTSASCLNKSSFSSPLLTS